MNSFPGKNFHGMGSEMLSKQAVLFYDGDCPLCNRVVTFILDHERVPHIVFSSLRSDATAHWLERNEEFSMPEDSVYFYNGERLFVKSSAVLRLLAAMKWYCCFFYIGWLLPKILRDKLYDFVAKRRKKLLKECRVDLRLKNRLLK